MRFAGALLFFFFTACASDERMELLLRGGVVYDGSGAEPSLNDVGIDGDRIVFVGDAAAEGASAETVLDVTGAHGDPGLHRHALPCRAR